MYMYMHNVSVTVRVLTPMFLRCSRTTPQSAPRRPHTPSGAAGKSDGPALPRRPLDYDENDYDQEPSSKTSAGSDHLPPPPPPTSSVIMREGSGGHKRLRSVSIERLPIGSGNSSFKKKRPSLEQRDSFSASSPEEDAAGIDRFIQCVCVTVYCVQYAHHITFTYIHVHVRMIVCVSSGTCTEGTGTCSSEDERYGTGTEGSQTTGPESEENSTSDSSDGNSGSEKISATTSQFILWICAIVDINCIPQGLTWPRGTQRSQEWRGSSQESSPLLCPPSSLLATHQDSRARSRSGPLAVHHTHTVLI